MKSDIIKASVLSLALGISLTLIAFTTITLNLYYVNSQLIIYSTAGLILGVLITSLIFYLTTSKYSRMITTLNDEAYKIKSKTYNSFNASNYTGEIGTFVLNLNDFILSLSDNFDTISSDLSDIMKIFNKLEQGIIALEKNKAVRFYNTSALSIVGNGLSLNKNIGDFDFFKKKLIPMCDIAIKTGKPVSDTFIFPNNKKNIDIYVSVVDIEKPDKGIIIFLTNSTEVAYLRKMRNEFAANVTHELKTPLTSIIGFLELLKGAERDEETRKYFYDIIDSETQRLLHLVDDMLLLSQVESMKDSVFAKKCDIHSEIEEAITHLLPLAQKRNIKIEVKVDSDLFVSASSIRLQQLFSNIIGNAIKYNIDNGEIVVKAYRDKNNVVIRIKDTGIGINPDHLDKIFERFYRSDTSRASEIQGNGLGLTIVKDVVNLYNGEIQVNSKLNQGSEFIISFPFANR